MLEVPSGNMGEGRHTYIHVYICTVYTCIYQNPYILATDNGGCTSHLHQKHVCRLLNKVLSKVRDVVSASDSSSQLCMCSPTERLKRIVAEHYLQNNPVHIELQPTTKRNKLQHEI